MSSDSHPTAGGTTEADGSWQLPRGRHKLSRRFVTDHQRQRLLMGAAQALSEHHYAALSVEHIHKQAGVSRTTFYEHFDNKRDCMLVAHEEAFDRLAAVLVRACAGQREWSAKVMVATGAAIDFAIQTPEQARLLVPEAIAVDSVLIERVIASTDFLVGLLRNGREQCPSAAVLPELTERALIGAVASMIGRRLLCGQVESLPALAPQLTHFLLIPYLGTEEAARIAEFTPRPSDLT